MELLLIRHAQPVRIEASEGPADPPLTARGQEEAARLAAWLASERIDAVWASPLRRARQTAEPLAAAHGLDVRVDEELCEWDRDDPTYIPVEELRELKDERWYAMVEGRWADLGGIDPDTFRSVIVACVERIIAASPGGRVAVVCHGGVINVYLAHVLAIERPLWFEPRYASISRVAASREGVRSLLSLNETAHVRDLA